MDALEINILLDTFTVKGKESGAVYNSSFKESQR